MRMDRRQKKITASLAMSLCTATLFMTFIMIGMALSNEHCDQAKKDAEEHDCAFDADECEIEGLFCPDAKMRENVLPLVSHQIHQANKVFNTFLETALVFAAFFILLMICAGISVSSHQNGYEPIGSDDPGLIKKMSKKISDLFKQCQRSGSEDETRHIELTTK